MALNPNPRGVRRSGSTSSIRHSLETSQHDLTPLTHSRRASIDDSVLVTRLLPKHPDSLAIPGPPSPRIVVPGAIDFDLPEEQAPSVHREPSPTSHQALAIHREPSPTFHQASAIHREPSPTLHKAPDSAMHFAGVRQPYKVFFVGPNAKRFELHNHLLLEKSPYFSRLIDEDPSIDQMEFHDIDPQAFKLWIRWMSMGSLEGPTDWTSTGHYLGLYTLARRWEDERLGNHVVDRMHAYYAANQLTAAPYRLEYIYTFTAPGDPMRDFLISTAAWRALHDDTSTLSDSMQGLVAKGSDLAVDFANALVRCAADPSWDVRLVPSCAFHVHSQTFPCGIREISKEVAVEVEVDSVEIANFDGP